MNTMKDECVNTIQTVLNLGNETGTIRNLAAAVPSSGVNCPSGIYQNSTSLPVGHPSCNGFRRYAMIDGQNTCCK